MITPPPSISSLTDALNLIRAEWRIPDHWWENSPESKLIRDYIAAVRAPPPADEAGQCCPFCGDVREPEQITERDPCSATPLYWRGCLYCGARGPVCDNDADALAGYCHRGTHRDGPASPVLVLPPPPVLADRGQA